MPRFSDFTFLSCDGQTPIHVRRCQPEGAVRGLVQIAHGIAEYAARYDAFAAFLADHGFLVVANDHLGHGQSIADPDALGFFAAHNGWALAVDDMHRLYEQIHGEYPDLPYFLFGHSMGSFLTRSYLIRYPTGLRGAVLSGTGQQPAVILAGGRVLSALEVRRRGPRFHSEALNRMAFGNYNRPFEPRRTDFDWLSRDAAQVDRYVADPLCGFVPSAGLLHDMMEGIHFNQKPANLARMDKALPVLFLSGDMDPVGAEGKGVRNAFASFQKAGMRELRLKLYPGGRHEMLNETNRNEVFQDVLAWLERWV
ncbi:MAG: lysophospholipase [Oscillospiraceae bacterium]|nr:lysophospholipase [Oscillospiraceae bacterium]